MLGIEIRALSEAELRRLLAVARAREQNGLIAQLTAELEDRPRRLEALGEPGFLAQPSAATQPAPPPARPRRTGRAVATVGAVVAAAAVVGLVFSLSPRPAANTPPQPVAAPRAAVAIAHPDVAPTSPAAIAAPAPVEAPAPIEAVATAATPPIPAPPKAARPTCADLRTAADRLVCSDPALAARERRLLAAYRNAMTQGADRMILEGEQATWKADRDNLADRTALANLYDKRIRVDSLWEPGQLQAAASGRTGVRASFGYCHVGGGYNCVVDGDTIWLEGQKIRIADIDAPETHDYRCAAERELGDRATRRLHDLLESGPITLQPIDRDEDTYGRKLRIVLVNGESVGDTLVSEGVARWYGNGRRPWC